MRTFTVRPKHLGKKHFFDVLEDGRPYCEVSVQLTCTCNHAPFETAKTQYGVICHPVRLVMDRFANGALIEHVSPNKLVLEKRAQTRELVEMMNVRVNEVRFAENEGPLHVSAKYKIFEMCRLNGWEAVFEPRFKSGGRADVIITDLPLIIEIPVSETDESLKEKERKYPQGIPFAVFRPLKEEKGDCLGNNQIEEVEG